MYKSSNLKIYNKNESFFVSF